MSAPDDLKARVDFALVNVPAFDAASGDRPIPALDLRLAELSAQFTMNTFDLPLGAIRFADSHDAALAGGTRDFCVIQKFGHLFHGPSGTVAQALLGALDDCAFLTGHIMERGGYYYLHDQCVLVNRRAWERLGRPAFGTPVNGPQRAAVPKRSAGDVHGGYTPLFLDPTGAERDWEGVFTYGWNAISESLRAGLRVTNWGEGPRRFKRYCYAYYGHPAEWLRVLADVTLPFATTDDGLREIVPFMNDAVRIASPTAADVLDIPHARIRAGLDHVIAPGPEAYRILEQIGAHPQTTVTLYAARESAHEPPPRFRHLPHCFVAADPVAEPAAFAALCTADNASVAISLGA
jgi:hypothetical protein